MVNKESPLLAVIVVILVVAILFNFSSINKSPASQSVLDLEKNVIVTTDVTASNVRGQIGLAARAGVGPTMTFSLPIGEGQLDNSGLDVQKSIVQFLSARDDQAIMTCPSTIPGQPSGTYSFSSRTVRPGDFKNFSVNKDSVTVTVELGEIQGCTPSGTAALNAFLVFTKGRSGFVNQPGITCYKCANASIETVSTLLNFRDVSYNFKESEQGYRWTSVTSGSYPHPTIGKYFRTTQNINPQGGSPNQPLNLTTIVKIPHIKGASVKIYYDAEKNTQQIDDSKIKNYLLMNSRGAFLVINQNEIINVTSYLPSEELSVVSHYLTLAYDKNSGLLTARFDGGNSVSVTTTKGQSTEVLAVLYSVSEMNEASLADKAITVEIHKSLAGSCPSGYQVEAPSCGVRELCQISPGQLIAIETRAGPETFNSSQLARTPNNYCKDAPIIKVAVNKPLMTSFQEYSDLVQGKSVTIPAGETWQIQYVIAQSPDIPIVCPFNKYDVNSKTCQNTTGFITLCSEGIFNPTVKACVVTPETKAVCANGVYDKDLEACVIQTTEAKCAQGVLSNDGRFCIVQPEPRIVCKQGFTPNEDGSLCLKTGDEAILCNNPYKLENGQCVYRPPTTSICEETYMYDNINKYCWTSPDNLGICPQETIKTNGQCVKNVKLDCGNAQFDSVLVACIDQPPIITTCPSGSVIDLQKKACVNQPPTVFVCPEKTTFDDSTKVCVAQSITQKVSGQKGSVLKFINNNWVMILASLALIVLIGLSLGNQRRR